MLNSLIVSHFPGPFLYVRIYDHYLGHNTVICHFMLTCGWHFHNDFLLNITLTGQYITQKSWDKQNTAPYQKGGDGHSDDEASDYIRPVVAVLCHPVNTRQEGQAHQPQRHDRLGQPGPFGFHRASDVHLKREEKEEGSMFTSALIFISSG